ncbi:hypothetical protein GGTG_06776 [Gaeumannomyces tritici R3-111a-1]|uniref:Uncharacterized protein n=1 Tax=Gaeumannomyces tritici (strain R3-111a-1) TaxID=644352 RepID=J3NZS9_GAET3|nr:hypothetical protein GGTG_06776 [Gaeumannomyces tritici R3-111a-1]EJT76862.1 hypothetical protein GGTG_06776 [Gaeumannomyces tritici R3-111a-1]
MSGEGADTLGDAAPVAASKIRKLSFRPARPLSEYKGEGSRPSPNKPSIINDRPLTETLFQHISNNNLSEARKLAQKKGVQLQNKYGPQGCTVLHMAAASESMVEVLRKLLGRPDVARHINQKDNAGRTALHEAAILATRNTILVELIDAGANPDILDQQRLTPLHAFIKYCQPGADHRRVFNSLVNYGNAEVNTKNSSNDTPLHDAASRDSETLIRLLLSHGADPDSVNAAGETPQALLPERSAAKRIFLEPRTKWTPRNLTKIPTEAPRCEGDRQAVCKSFYVTVWFFYRPASLSWSQTSTAYSVIYDKETIAGFERQFIDIIQSSSNAARQKAKTNTDKTHLRPSSYTQDTDTSRDAAFEVRSDDIWKWIHLPANNMDWVKDLVYRLTLSDQGSARLRQALQFIDRHVKDHKDNRGYFRLPHVEEERQDDDIWVADDDDMADSPPVSPRITSSSHSINSPGTNQHSSNPGYFPPVQISLSSPPRTSEAPKGPETYVSHNKSRARSELPNEAWRSRKVTPGGRRRLSLVIPYFDFETELYLGKGSTSRTSLTPGDPDGAGSGDRQFNRLTALKQHYRPFEGPRGLQLPQTLDESYYHMLADDQLHARNRDQIIYKWSSDIAVNGLGTTKTQPQDTEGQDRRDLNGRVPAEASDGSSPHSSFSHQTDRNKLLVVHQLWLWKLDENTVITTHPERWHTGNEDTLVETIRQSGIGDFQEPEDLIEHIVSECARFIEEYRYAGLGEHILDIFENSIATKSNQEVQCFKRFIAQLGNEPGNNSKSPATAVEEHSNEKESITEETKLIREIKDIHDELQMLGRVLEDQANMVERFARLFWPDAEKDEKMRQQFTDYCGIQNLRARTVRMDGNAHQTLQDLYYLVQVKQAQSSLHEAITATVMSKRAQTLNDYILVFTTITVIFAPLAFMTSLFALPISSFPRDGGAGSVSYAADWLAVRITAGEIVSLASICFMLYLYFVALRNRDSPGGIREPRHGAGSAQPVRPANSTSGAPTGATSIPTRRRVTTMVGDDLERQS